MTDWTTHALSDQMDASALDAHIGLLSTRPELTGQTLAFLVVHEGRIVREFYAEETSSETTLISWSMAKSMVHALVGCAVKDGLVSVEDSHLFPEWENDERSSITLANLLNMASGLEWVEDYVEGSQSDVITMLFGDSAFKGDHAGYAINKPLTSTPGTTYYYSSGTTNIVAKYLARALGETAGESRVMQKYMQSRLFDPLGMTSAVARFDEAGTFIGSSYVFATARDFARFGYLYLNDGVWDNVRLLPEGWVSNAGRIIGHEDVMNYDYGSHWWIPPGDPRSIIAHGYDGQLIWVAPHRDVVVVRLGKTDAALGGQLRDRLLDVVLEFPLVNGGDS